MKKLINLSLLFAAAILFAACGSNSPKDVVKQVLEYEKSGDYEKIIDLCLPDSGASEFSSEEREQGIKDLKILESISESFKGNIISYKIISEEINGEEAIVGFTEKCEKDEDNKKKKNINIDKIHKIKLKKNVNGEWKICSFWE